uniref:Ig-like domain-containing protein n=2 Tax=Crocosphaera watsonii TaxID=263511 RepID=UPI00056A65F6
MVQLSLSTETNFPGDLNALVEDQGTVLTVRFELDEPAPAGGLRVFLDSTETEILNRLDFAQLVSDFFAGVGVENIVAFPSPQRNDDRSGLALTIAAGAESASFQINVLNQEEADPPQRPYDGLLPVEFSLITADQIPVEDQGTITGVGDYTVDQSAASSTVLFADTESQLPSTTPGYDEAVSGDISGDPNNPLLLPLTEGTTTLSATTGGGISDQEYVTVTIPEGFQLDSLVLASFSTPGNPGFIGVQEGSTFTEPLDNSANRGNFLGYLTFGSEVGTDILDDIGRGNGAIGFDGPLPSGTYTFALQQIQGSTDYTLEFNVSEVTNTDPEAENDSYSVATNQTLDIDAVAGVLFNDSDADQDSLTAAIETLPDNGSVTLNPDGSFSYTPDTDFAGIDTFTYTVSDGNDGSDTAEVSINVGQLPIVSFEAIPATISEEGTAEERLLRLEFNVVGDIPEGGLFILFESLFGITDQMDGGSDAGDFNNLGLVPPFDRENNIIGVRLDANQAEMLLPIVNDLTEEGTTTFDFALAPGEGYIIDPDQNATSFTITDDNGGPGVGPTIALSVSETNLAEGDPLTVNFDVVAGEIPPEGVDVLVQSTVPAALGQFDLSNLDDLVLSGVTNVRPGDTRGLSFIATLTDPNASITLDIFDDIIAEDPIELPFTLVNGELYEVDPTAESVTLTVSDDIDIPGPTVGITLDRSDVVEGETIVLTINTTGEIPDGGLQVLINDVESAANGLRSLTEFNISGVQFTGIEGFPLPAEGDSGFFVTVSDPVATITLPIFDDQADEIEEEEVFTFAVIDGEAYGVDPDAPDVTLSIADPPNELPTVSISTTTPEVTEDEAPEARVTLTVDGEIPNDG